MSEAPANAGKLESARQLLRGLASRVDLKTRLSLFIGLLLGVVLLLAVYAVLGNSKRSVQGEIDAVMRLATSLLDGHAIPAEATDAKILPVLINIFDHTRHLCVERPAGTARLDARRCPAEVDDEVPDWFVAHVTVAPRELRRQLAEPDGRQVSVVVRSDPADEIREAWNEARPLLLLIVAIGFLTNAIVVITVWRAFKPIDLIRDALDRIGRGELHPGLPAVTTPELRIIIDGMVELGISLEEAKSDNQRLLRHSLEVQERERRAIATELHDEMGQSLAAMDAEAALLQQRLGSPVAELTQRALGIRAGIASLYDGLHSLLARLRPAGLDEFGLGPALQNLVADWSGRCPHIRFEVGIELERVSGGPLVQVYLYRIAQEALINATRHAEAQRISVMLFRDVEGAAHLRISDDGRGLPPELRTPGEAHPGEGRRRDGERGVAESQAWQRGRHRLGHRVGLGLLGMAERAETLGADLSIESSPGNGTCISLRLPQPAAGDEVRLSPPAVTELTRKASLQ